MNTTKTWIHDVTVLLLALFVVGSVCILAIQEKSVPGTLDIAMGAVLGYFFAATVGAKVASGTNGYPTNGTPVR